MRGFGLLAAVATFVLAFAANGVYAQTATTAPVGKPLALLAGLRPPREAKHESRHRDIKHVARAKAAHEKTAGRTRHGKLAAHAWHASATKVAMRHHHGHDHGHARPEQAVTASAFAEEPPPQANPDPPPASASNWPTVNAAPANDFVPPVASPSVAPVSANAPASDSNLGSSPDAAALKVQTIKITAANPDGLPDPAAGPGASATAMATDSADSAPVTPTAQTVLAAPVHRDMSRIGSASWIAQVLAALGGAIAAGAVAWFLIRGGPVRTYG